VDRNSNDELIVKVNKEIDEIQEEIAINRREQKALSEFAEEALSLKRLFDDAQERVASYWAGTEFGKKQTIAMKCREAMFSDLSRIVENEIDMRDKEIKRLAKEESCYDEELNELRRSN
jgi:hypothetical protein